MDNRVLFLAFDITPGTIRMAPICAGYAAPPFQVIVQRDRVIRSGKAGRTGHESFWRRSGILLCGRLPLSHGDVTGGVHKLRKFLVRHDGLIHSEAVNMNANMRFCVGKPLNKSAANGQPGLDIIGRLRCLRLRGSPHPELAPGNPDHVFRSTGRLAWLRNGDGLRLILVALWCA